MLKHHRPLSFKHLLVQDSETESDNDMYNHRMAQIRITYNRKHKSICKSKKKSKEKLKSGEDHHERIIEPTIPNVDPEAEAILEKAKEYQKIMKKTAIPRARLSNLVVVNWKGLAKTLEKSYGQPMHYMTHMLCRQWDKARFGGEDSEKALDSIMSAEKAEALMWEVESVHRLTTSHVHLASLWLSDPHFQVFVNQVIVPPSSK
ncbi:hypothetical protein K1719_032498 [Acacia pycnantha]|nr:hypothetical protein K1719_032498 [Acacia pycnantha]